MYRLLIKGYKRSIVNKDIWKLLPEFRTKHVISLVDEARRQVTQGPKRHLHENKQRYLFLENRNSADIIVLHYRRGQYGYDK